MRPINDPTFDAKDEPIRVVLETAERAVPPNWQHLQDWQNLNHRILRIRNWRIVRLYLMPLGLRINGDQVYLASDSTVYLYHFEQGQPSTGGGASIPSRSSYRRISKRRMRGFTPNQLSLLADTISSIAKQ